MKSMKTVLLGSAAAIIATGAAQAADLPVRAAPVAVQYVELCPAFGRGFYRLPGGDICIRHFGSAKFGMGFQDERDFVAANIAQNALVPTVRRAVANTGGWQWTIRPGWDFRSPTEYGTLRTVVQLRADQRAGIYESQNPNLIGISSRNILFHRAYIEWAGFVVGRAATNFTYWDQDNVISAQGGDPKATIPFMITYVFQAPGGWTATIGVEESNQWNTGFGPRFATTNALTGVTLGGWRGMDVVGTLATEQPWGDAKIGGLAHLYQTNNGIVRESDWAWAALAGITFKLPTLGDRDQILFQANWCNGVIQGCGIQGGSSNTLTSFERSGQYLEGLQRTDVDAYLVPSGTGWNFEKVKAWSVAAQLRHYWAPLWRSNLTWTYTKVNVPAAGEGLLAPAGTGTLANGFRGDASAWDVGANLIWGRSRQTAEIGVEVIYKSVKQTLPRDTTIANLPPGTDVDPSGWIFNAFLQRNW
jgi:hypothetical protein